MSFKFTRDLCCFEGYELTNMTTINPTRYTVAFMASNSSGSTQILELYSFISHWIHSQCSICGKSNKQYFAFQADKQYVYLSCYRSLNSVSHSFLFVIRCGLFFILEWQTTWGNLWFCSQHVSAWIWIITGECNKLHASQAKFNYIFLQQLRSNLS